MQIHELRQPLNEVDLVGPGGLFRGIKQAATAARTPAGRAALKQQMVSSAPLVDPKTGQATPTAYAQISKNIQDDKRVNDFKDRTWSNWTNHYARSTPAGPAAITNFSKFFDDWIDQHLMATDMPMDKLDPQERAKFEQVKNLAASRFSPRNTAGFRAELDRVIDAAFAAMSATRLKAQAAAQARTGQAANQPAGRTAARYSSPAAEQTANATGIGSAQLARLARHLSANGERVTVSSTGSPSLDALLKSAGLL